MIAALFFFAAAEPQENSKKDLPGPVGGAHDQGLHHSLSRAPALQNRIRHFECFNIVRIIGHRKKSGKTDSDIAADLTTHCAKLHAPRRDICEAIVPSRIDNISAQLADKHKPQDICESLGFARPPAARRFVQREQCVKFAEKAKTQADKIETPAGNESLKGNLPKPFGGRGLFSRLFGKAPICKDVQPEERVACYVVSRLVVKELRAGLKDSMTGGEICDKLEAKKLLQFKLPADANVTETLTPVTKKRAKKANATAAEVKRDSAANTATDSSK